MNTAVRVPRSGHRLWKRLAAEPTVPFALAGLVLILLALFAVPFFYSVDPNAVAPIQTLKPPTAEHLMGTDNLGRDVFARFIYGGRVSLLVGLTASLLGGAVGIVLGLLSGFFGRWVDTAISSVVEVLLAFPGVLLALIVVAILGAGVTNVVIAVAVSFVPSFTRVTRAAVLQVRELDYVEAAYALGSPTWRILTFHILPNILRPVLSLITLGIGLAMLEGAALSFIGLGVQPPDPEWGAMLNAGRTFIGQAWWVTVFPGLGIFITTLALNLLSDALTDAADPASRARTSR